MSDTPDIPALRVMSAERLTVGDVFWGVVHGQEARKGWATLEANEGQEVLEIKRWESRARLDVQVQTPEGPTMLAFFEIDQVLIEHKDHPNAVTEDSGHLCDDWSQTYHA
jgi:hypothetical protein